MRVALGMTVSVNIHRFSEVVNRRYITFWLGGKKDPFGPSLSEGKAQIMRRFFLVFERVATILLEIDNPLLVLL